MAPVFVARNGANFRPNLFDAAESRKREIPGMRRALALPPPDA